MTSDDDSTPLRSVAPPPRGPFWLVHRGGGWLPRQAAGAATRAHAPWLRRRAGKTLARWPAPRPLCLGSGAAPLPGWLNVDLTGAADVHLDLRFGIPLPDGSVERVYSEHVIEHFSLDEGRALFRECRRLLSRDGVLRLATPDLAALLRVYGDRPWQHPPENPQWPELAEVDSAVQFLNCSFHNWGHQYLYDFDELERRLAQAGFVDVRRCDLGQSDHGDLRGLETRRESDLIVEARVARGR
jgi:predicted SAM-dependent methyltransferase